MHGRSPSRVGWFAGLLIAVGLLGASQGVPIRLQQLDRHLAAERHFDMRCETAEVIVPAEPVKADGIVWRTPNAARQSDLTRADFPRDFVDVGRGGYGVLELIDEKGVVESWRWLPTRNPNGWNHATTKLPAPTLRYEVLSEDISDPLDRMHGVQGARTTIVDGTNGTVVARRVVYGKGQGSGHGGAAPVRRLCPEDALAQESCDVSGCTTINFVTSVVRPSLPPDYQNAFHMYRGVGQKKFYCSFDIRFGPNIKPEDVEWWAGADQGFGRQLHLRIRGTSDHVWCESFFGPHFLTSHLRFFEGRRQYAADALRQKKVLGSPEAPLGLASTLRPSHLAVQVER